MEHLVAYTTGDLVTRVQQRVRDTGYSSTEIISYLNDAQNDVFNEYRLPFTQASQNYTLATGVADITNGSGLPSNYVQALDLVLNNAGTQQVIQYMDVSQIDALYPNVSNTTTWPPNIPSKWYYFAETINVFPSPANTYSVTLRYYKKPALLTVDGDVPDLPSEFEELLVMGAAYRVLQVKDNYDQAAILQNKYDEILQKLVVKYSQAQVGMPTRMRINKYAVGKRLF